MSAANPLSLNAKSDQSSPSIGMVAVTPSDSADLAITARLIYCGVGGDIAVTDITGAVVTHKNVPTGGYIGPFAVTRVMSTSTTATNLIAYA